MDPRANGRLISFTRLPICKAVTEWSCQPSWILRHLLHTNWVKSFCVTSWYTQLFHTDRRLVLSLNFAQQNLNYSMVKIFTTTFMHSSGLECVSSNSLAVADLGSEEGGIQIMAHKVRRKFFGGATPTFGSPRPFWSHACSSSACDHGGCRLVPNFELDQV